MTGTAPHETTRATDAPAGSSGDARRLVLLRHAKAEPAGSSPDHARPLALHGRAQATQVGQTLTASGLVPDVVLCSSALRTRQTWDLVAGRLPAAPSVTVDDALYELTVRGLLAVVRELPDTARTVLVVGHEPTMGAGSAFFAGPGSEAGSLALARVGLPTGGYGLLEADAPWSDWDRGTAILRYAGRPAA
ncbi:phosphohistidine phosphatase [Luteimicrobium album]|uniref:Phosphohistidine phosphatase n=1 Tax=Luteimicrobium album TaxID=1054550 RepID=A0ABQ6I667_9MICO|nr:histidine phosphatase family protein [Luteimicrobium album]GMA26275.1 phosphohistidine phosphatase [Luteimicrobium album]